MISSQSLLLLLALLGNLVGLGSSHCGADQVLCLTTSKCIRISYICDGDNDCGDGLDESFCPEWKATGCSDRGTASCTRDGGLTCVPMAEYCSSTCSGVVDPRICVMMNERVIRHISNVVIPEPTTAPPLPSPAPNTLHRSELQGELFAETFNKTMEHSTCPVMYTRVGDHCLSFFYILKLSWGEAVQFCKLMNGQLVSFSGNHDMFISILKHLREHGITADFWTGGRYVMDTEAWTWLTDSTVELGPPFWAVRYEVPCTNRHGDYSHAAQYWLNKTACYHYHQAPGPKMANLCAAVTYKHYYYMTDEDCLGRMSPLCLANTNGTSPRI